MSRYAYKIFKYKVYIYEGKQILMQNEHLIFKNMFNKKQTSLKQNQASFATSTDTDSKHMIADAKPTVMH